MQDGSRLREASSKSFGVFGALGEPILCHPKHQRHQSNAALSLQSLSLFVASWLCVIQKEDSHKATKQQNKVER